MICDVDNTIIVKYTTLTEEAKDCINRLRAHGVYFSVASGRDLKEVKAAAQNWGYDDFELLIGYNGGSMWDNLDQTEENYYRLSAETVKEIFDLMRPFDTYPRIYVDDYMLCGKESPMLLEAAKKGIMKFKLAKSEDEFYRDIPKVMFGIDEDKMPELEKYLAEHKSDKFAYFKTQKMLMEFCDPRIHKAFALRKFCEKHGISMDQVVAFGDTTNDNTMIQESGLGVCMLNGSDDTKAIADVISEKACDDNGWAYFVEENILKPRGW